MTTETLSGVEILKQIISGQIPPPSMAMTIPMQLLEVEKGAAVFEAQADNNHLNPLGGVHGGYAATVLDSATGCAVFSILSPGDKYTTVDLNVKMLKPIPIGITLKAVGKIIHESRRLGVSEGQLLDAEGTLYAHATATCMILRKAAD